MCLLDDLAIFGRLYSTICLEGGGLKKKQKTRVLCIFKESSIVMLVSLNQLMWW